MVTTRLLTIVLAVTLGLSQAGCAQAPSPAATTQPAAAAGNAAGAATPRPARARARSSWWLDEQVTTAVGLSDDQLRRVKELMASDPSRQLEHRKRERHAGLSYLRALSEDPYDPAYVEQRSAELIKVLSENQRQRVVILHALRDILTGEQWTRLWEVAPQAIQVGRFRATLGPKIRVTSATPAPEADDADEALELADEDPDPAP